MLFVDMSIASSPQHLLAALFLARARGETLALTEDDLHHLYWLAGGISSTPFSNDECRAFTQFFHDCRVLLRAHLPENPRLTEAAAPAALIEQAVDRGWAKLVPAWWGASELLLSRLFALPDSAIEGFCEWDGTLQDFLSQPWVGEDYDYFAKRTYPVGQLGSEGVDVSGFSVEADIDLGRFLIDFGKEDAAQTGRNWALEPLAEAFRTPGSPLPGDVFADLRCGALVGTEFVFDGAARHFTLSPSVARVAQVVAVAGVPLMPQDPALGSTVAGGILRLQPSGHVEEALELIAHAPLLERFTELLRQNDELEEASAATYLGKVVRLLTPRPIQVLVETVQFRLRRGRLP